MYKIVSTVLMAFILLSVVAKEGKNKSKNNVHKIIFQLTTNDTMAHKALMKQLNNITTVAPTTKIEIVCHGPGLEMLITEKSIVHQKIKQLSAIGVSFIACEFSMKERNVPQDKIIPEAGYVKAGIIEIVSKQEQGWSYIKSGF
ncbi:MAG: DsrE family protein [Chitinophagales bacterium]|jgi:intracellular sulfur oxidation DsrE/DsrF family protein|nr:DsrE family protein [Chitinophagales bacterium]